MLAGRPHELPGNGSPRWTAAGPRKAGAQNTADLLPEGLSNIFRSYYLLWGFLSPRSGKEHNIAGAGGQQGANMDRS